MGSLSDPFRVGGHGPSVPRAAGLRPLPWAGGSHPFGVKTRRISSVRRTESPQPRATPWVGNGMIPPTLKGSGSALWIDGEPSRGLTLLPPHSPNTRNGRNPTLAKIGKHGKRGRLRRKVELCRATGGRNVRPVRRTNRSARRRADRGSPAGASGRWSSRTRGPPTPAPAPATAVGAAEALPLPGPGGRSPSIPARKSGARCHLSWVGDQSPFRPRALAAARIVRV